MRRDLKSLGVSTVLIILCLFCFSAKTFAGSYYKNILVGDRAATMGGAYIAISDDASGTFYNPAGIIYATGNSVSGSANVYHIQRATYVGAIAGNDWSRSSTTLIPNFFGLVKKFKKFSLGFSFVVPDSFVEHQDQQFTNLSNIGVSQYVLNLHSEDITYLVGPSFSYKISDTLSMGITLGISMRKYRMIENQLVVFSTGQASELTFINTSQTENGVLPKLGIMWSPIKPLSLGLTISKTVILSSHIENQPISAKSNTDITAPPIPITQSSYRQKMPTQVSFGAAYFPSPFWLVAFDIDYYSSADFKRRVINYSLGGEYYLNESNALRAGFFTNFSNQFDIDPAKANQPEKLDQYGFSIGYTTFGKSSSLTLGMIYSKGSGLSQPYGDYTLIKLTRFNLTALMAASYGF